MTHYVKNEKVAFDPKAIKEAYSKAKNKQKYATSINLSEEIVTALKALAKQKKSA